MRILHVSTRLILGGSQENTVLSCEGQARLGHEVHLAFGPIYGPEGSLLARVEAFGERCRSGEEVAAGGAACQPVRTHVLPDMVREISPGRDWRAYGQVRDLVARLRPDIVHTHSSKAGMIGRAAAWDAYRVVGRQDRAAALGSSWRCGIVHTIHGPPFMPYDGGVIRPAKTYAVNKVYEIAERFAARRCHRIVSVCDEMTRQFRARGIGRPEQYVTVYSGMETGRFLEAQPGESRPEVRSRLGIAPGRVVIGIVARLAEHKGHDDVLTALVEDLAADQRLTLLWVGDGWWRERLVARARGMMLGVRELDRPAPESDVGDGRVLLTGLVLPERVPGLMRAMDVLVHPSYREGLPRTVPQALLCGTCPVAYDVDGTREVCIEGRTGRLVRVGDFAGLRAAILDLVEHPEKRMAMAARGREMCRERFSAERMVAELERVYGAALGKA